MFSNCTSLADLNKRRAELTKSGTPVKEINAAYNIARKALMATQQAVTSFNAIPTISAPNVETKLYAVVSILGKSAPNEIVFGDGGVYI